MSMPRKYHGGERVHSGAYLNTRTAEFASIPRGGGELPGAGQTMYIRVPAAAVMFVGPLMGLLFVILLPLAGVLAIPVVFFRLLQRLGREVGGALVRGAVPGWVPGAAYLVRRGRRQRQPLPREETGHDKADMLSALEEEIRRQRRRWKE
jgi:hypothetical protein